MHVKLFLLLAMFLLNVISNSALSSNHTFSFKQLSIEDGLPQLSVNTVFRDHKGALWIGTRNGLASYYLQEVKSHFNEKGNSNSLPDNYIIFVTEDHSKNIWVSTNKGVAKYNSSKNNFDRILSERAYSCLFMTNEVLLGGNELIYKFNYKTKNIDAVALPGNLVSLGLEEHKIIKLHLLNDSLILVGTKHAGLYIYNYLNNQVKQLPFGKYTILSICVDSKSNIYLSVYKDGIYYFNLKGDLLAHYTLQNSNLTNNVILSIIEKDGKILMGTDGGGINIINPENGKITSIQNTANDENSLPVNSISVLYNDNEGNLWAGSVRGGIIGIRETFLKTYKNVPLNNSNGLSEKSVISLYEDSKKMLWIGTDGGGLNKYDPFTEQFRHYPSTYGDKIESITELSPSELLVCLYIKGLFVFNKNTGQYRSFTIVDQKTNSDLSLSGYSHFTYRATEDKIYILSQNAYIYNTVKKTFSTFKTKGRNIALDVLSLGYSDETKAYLFRLNNVFEVTHKNDSLRVLFKLEPTVKIKALVYDEKSNLIWLGTDEGLGYFDVKSDTLFHKIETNLFNTISCLFLDENRRLWISAQNMLFSYIIDENKFVTWSESDGFSPNEILFTYQKPSKTNNIYLAGANGLVKIEKNITIADELQYQVELLDIIFNGSSYISHINERSRSVRIPWNYRTLSVAVALHEKDLFLKTLFRYNIKSGMNSQYVETYSNKLELPSLSPGSYSINVSCKTKSGNWSPPLNVITIVINPPWYQSKWFYFSLVFMIISGIYFFQRNYTRKHRMKLKWELKEHQQKVNEEKINFLVNVSHELRTPLTLIYAPLKRLINEGINKIEPDIVANQLNAIYRQTRKMKDIINMVLDLNRVSTDGNQLKKASHNINEWIISIADDFKTEFNEKNVVLNFQLDNTLPPVWFDEWKCQIVFSNMLINALKFSEPGTRVLITSLKSDDFVRVSVTDEGIGLGNTLPEKLFTRFYQGEHNVSGSGIGLSYAKLLVESHGGNIGAYNNQQKGATFFYELPLLQGLNEQLTVPQTSLSENRPVPSYQDLGDFSCSNYSILIVEDKKELRDFLHESFKTIFKHSYTADDGLAAIEIIKNRQPDIVVSDVMMPRMDGFELCRQVKNTIEISHIPIVLLTARGDQDSTTLGYKLGADFYVSKPFEMDFLLTILKNILQTREKVKQKYKEYSFNLSPQETTISNADENFMMKFNKIISENLSNPELTIEYLTDNMAMSRASLYNKVKALTGMGVNDYINKIRIEKAANLLIKSDMNISEISSEVGFTYQRYFSSIFKNNKGVTPSEFREKNRER